MPIEGLHIRRAEPDDSAALYEMFSSPKVYEGTLQLPYPSREQWRKRITETESCYNLVAVSGEHVIGMLSVDTFPNRPRRRHVGIIGISVTEAWQRHRRAARRARPDRSRPGTRPCPRARRA